MYASCSAPRDCKHRPCLVMAFRSFGRSRSAASTAASASFVLPVRVKS
ncbi:hypothetical protein N9M16_03450 [Candidatus Dependentiae bacterium]|nr:hypothetical protein [Candidatus Dependentiae bacterium]